MPLLKYSYNIRTSQNHLKTLVTYLHMLNIQQLGKVFYHVRKQHASKKTEVALYHNVLKKVNVYIRTYFKWQKYLLNICSKMQCFEWGLKKHLILSFISFIMISCIFLVDNISHPTHLKDPDPKPTPMKKHLQFITQQKQVSVRFR